jgi:valyl-tRNA synthetase
MPFITEEIWGFLPPEGRSASLLISADWPRGEAPGDWGGPAARVEKAKEVIRGIRNIRAEAAVAPSKPLNAVIVASDETLDALRREERHLKRLAGLAAVEYATDKGGVPEETASAVTGGAEIFVPLDELLDYGAEFERLNKERTRALGDVERMRAKLANPGFTGKAPARVVDAERERLAAREEAAAKLAERLAVLEKKIK